MNLPLDRRTHDRLVPREGRSLTLVGAATGVAAALTFGAVAFFGGPVGNSPVGRPLGGGVVAGQGGTGIGAATAVVALAEPSFNSLTDSLIDQEDFDSFDNFGQVGVDSSLVDKYSNPGIIKWDPGLQCTPSNNCDVAEDSGVVEMIIGRGGSGKAFRAVYGGQGGIWQILIGTEGKLGTIGGLGDGLPEVEGPYTHFYYQVWFRISTGADPGAQGSGSIKGMQFWHDGPGTSQRYQMSPHRAMCDDCDAYAETRWDVGPPHPPDSVTDLSHWVGQADGSPPVFADYADDAWHRYTIEYYSVEDPTGNNGWQWWLDGVLVFDNLNNVGPCADANTPSCPWGRDYTYEHDITHYTFGMGQFRDFDIGLLITQFTMDIDDLIVWTN